MKHKYTAKFDFVVRGSSFKKGTQIAHASLEPLAALMPEIDFECNSDLASVAFPATCINEFNDNGHGISSEVAVAVAKNFLHKPINIEHGQYDIVGHLITVGFSDKASGEIITEEAALKMRSTYNLSLGGVIYKRIWSGLVDAIERQNLPKTSRDEEWDEMFPMPLFSASWEIGFEDYVIAIGNKYLEKCELIEDEAGIEKYSKFLKWKGGTGFDEEGRPVFCLIVGEATPLGIGFTSNPAADVQGILIKAKSEKEDEEEDEEEEDEAKKKCAASVQAKKDEEKSSLFPVLVVSAFEKLRISHNMTPEQIKELLKGAMGADAPETAVASLQTVFTKALEDANAAWKTEKSALETAKAEIEAQAKALKEQVEASKAEVAKLNDKATSLQSKIDELTSETEATKKDIALAAAVERFTGLYKVEADALEIVKAELAEVCTDSDKTDKTFKKYAVLFASSVIKPEGKKEVAIASKDNPPPNSSQPANSLSQKFTEFKVSITK